MAQVLCNMIDFDMDVQEAIEEPRIASAGFPRSFHPHTVTEGVLYIEPDVDTDARRHLLERGHKLQPFPDLWISAEAAAGVMSVIHRSSRSISAGADPRGEGSAAGW
jgi:gamma-glutamyltranspeptidase/glutathione hydrolase